MELEKDTWLWIIIQDPGGNEMFLGQHDEKKDISFIPAFYEKDDAQYRINYENRQSFGSTGSADGYETAVKIIPGGYAVEAKIPYRSIKPSEGLLIGFDLQVNDDQGSGVRDSIAKWNDPTNNSWQSTTGYGVIVLTK